jgi:hypothetical protein
MLKIYLRNILRFLIVVLFQFLVFENIQIGGSFSPYVYIIFILLLPFETSGWVLLVTSFLLGLSVDLLLLTPGYHASAATFMAALRPFVLRTLAPRDGYEPGTFPRIYYYGFLWFAKYALILVLAHHFFLFFMEVFRMSFFLLILTKTIINTIISSIIIILSQYFVFRK